VIPLCQPFDRNADRAFHASDVESELSRMGKSANEVISEQTMLGYLHHSCVTYSSKDVLELNKHMSLSLLRMAGATRG